tara:strand:- start:183 stop:431 length:249 start_codon:yes stop_codon:yes gene_type:complete
MTDLERDVLAYIHGLRGPRENEVSSKQIYKRFAPGHTAKAVSDALYALMFADLASPGRKAPARRGNYRDAYYWSVTTKEQSA